MLRLLSHRINRRHFCPFFDAVLSSNNMANCWIILKIASFYILPLGSRNCLRKPIADSDLWNSGVIVYFNRVKHLPVFHPSIYDYYYKGHSYIRSAKMFLIKFWLENNFGCNMPIFVKFNLHCSTLHLIQGVSSPS